MAHPGTGEQADSELPDKLYFRIGEVSRLVGVPQYVLRYWESEFPTLAPVKSGRSHRLYRRKDVELLLEIKHLLYDERYTIEGARKHLQGSPQQGELFPPAAFEAVRKELMAILKLLK